jgi:protein arginine N-methyltransferase 1
MTYSLSDYGRMIADKERMEPYVFALKAAIKPDSVVLDIGAGMGIHALLACKFGARRVYAIEPNEATYLGRELAEVNGFADRIDFIQDLSTRVTLPERADVIVSDLRGVLPLFGAHIPSIIDARQRHLAPGGTLIPKRDTLWVALVTARNVYADIVKPWDHPYGLSLEPAKQIALNSWSDADTDSIRSANLLTTPQPWATLDYSMITDPDVGRTDMPLKATRDGTAHGWLIWFNAELAEGIGISCGPEQAKIAEVYGRGFFPLLEPVSIVEGDTISLTIEADLIDKQYEWRWHTRVLSKEDPGLVKAEFKQATDSDSVLNPNRIAEYVSNDRPSLVKEGQIDRFILERMDGTTTNKEIAAQTRKRFSNRFKDDGAALIYVYELSRQYY